MRILLLMLAFLLPSLSAAQDAERIDAATVFLKSKGQQALMKDMLSPEGVMAQMGLFAGQLPADKTARLAELVSEEMASIRPAMESAMVAGMADNFTLEEIRALADFYDSDVGASAMSKMRPFMAQTMQALSPDFLAVQQRLARRIQEEMEN